LGVYETLGLKPIINASGAVTRLGGAPMKQAVLEAFCQAAAESVPLDALQGAACRVLAATTGAEAGLVTSGAAAGLTLGTAAILAGYDLGRMERLPHCQDFPHQFVVAREHRNGYDHAVRAAGARLVEVGFHEIASGAGVRRVEAWEYAAAFGPATAGVLYVLTNGSCPPLHEVVRVAHAQHLPVLVDAAGELPPRERLQSIIDSGADLVVFSGGKAIGGPQATGILCGRRDLVGSAALQMLDMDDHWELWQPPAELIDRGRLEGMPRHGIGRGFKVSKEQIVALLKALELFVADDGARRVSEARRRLGAISASLSDCPVRCQLQSDGEEGWPLLEIQLDPQQCQRGAVEVCRALRAGSPPCYLGHGALAEGKLVVHPMHLDDARTAQLAERLRAELR